VLAYLFFQYCNSHLDEQYFSTLLSLASYH